MAESIPIKLELPTRTNMRDSHLRDQQIYNNDIDLAEGGEPFLAASVAADRELPTLAAVRNNLQGAFPTTALGPDVEFWGDIEGVAAPQATGSLGFVIIGASVSGGVIQPGDALVVKGKSNGPRFEARILGRYFDGQHCAIASADTGRDTNLPAGTTLQWDNAPPGIAPYAIVVEIDEEGLVGGRDAAQPEEHRRAILNKRADPPAARNDAHYRHEAGKAGVPVQTAYSYPAMEGAGTTGLTFTAYPQRYGGDSNPDEQQLRLVGEHVGSEFDADDSVIMMTIVSEPVVVAYRLKWASGYAWANPGATWPEYTTPENAIIARGAAGSATEFQLATADGVYSGVTAPTVGKALALYDAANAKFVRKVLGTVTGTGPWTVTLDTTHRSSDETYVPIDGQRVSPWSESLEVIVRPVVDAMTKLGPGEVFDGPLLDGERRKRRPPPSLDFPQVITQDALETPLSGNRVPQLSDREVIEGDGARPSEGESGAYVNRITLGDLCAFPMA